MRPLKSIFLGAVMAFMTTALIGASAAAQQGPSREIIRVSGDLYRATNNNHHTVFLVTDDGIVLSDPIDTDFSRWLRGELEERFGVPVRYVIYSHHHRDHASGGAIFDDTATFVGHENLLRHLAMPPANTPLPADAENLDANHNGRLEPSEASGDYKRFLPLFDADGDGAISGPEATRGPLGDVRAPDVTYTDRMAISLGGKSVELIFAGIMTHTDDMSLLRFPGERAIFVVDWISSRRLPYRTLGAGMLDAWLNSIRMAEALDFDFAVGGHGVVGNKADVIEFRNYLEELRDEVATGIAAGQSLAELQETILMDRYRSWLNYNEWRILNIEGMYRILTQ
ncbi:MAG: MBL fold metallo-hydrolase [Gammaproteobacteria bacterium]|nr:MBL fold metallo-hydrolase [Gammaproteobacteria bacterium]